MLLTTRRVEKIWGRESLPPPFAAPDGQRIGEIWFEPPAGLPDLLAKFIFTSEKLSVQVHPNDAQSEDAGLGRQGKEECWLVVDAEAGAKLGVGFRAEVSAGEMRAAALDGSIEELLEWHSVKPGDFFYIPAGTVHAIGGGVSIIEIQQNCDITYRLYDYGRPRDLHLEQAVAIANGGPHDPALRGHIPPQGDVSLVDGPAFRLDRISGEPDADTAARYDGAVLLLPREGKYRLDGDDVLPGQCAMARSIKDILFDDHGECLIAQPISEAISD